MSETDAQNSKGTKAKGKAKEASKPFPELIQEDVIPAALKAFQSRGVADLTLQLQDKTLWGSFANGRRQFQVLFAEETLQGSKFFAAAVDGLPASTVESFMIDERKVDVDLLVFYLTQRLHALQWY